jgi:hypothetical protein
VECAVGTTCNTENGLCESPVFVDSLPGLNEACVPGTSCKLDYYCKADGVGGGLCAAQPVANESCADAPCRSGLYCSPDSLCKPYPLPGQPCGLDKAGFLSCDGRQGFCEKAADSMSGTCKPNPEAGQPCLTSDGNPTGHCPTAGLHCDNTATPPVCKGPGKAGEVCLTAIETALTGTFRITVEKQTKLSGPWAETPTHVITMGFDEDLDDAAKKALRAMIRHIASVTGLSDEDAYTLCSVAADLHVTQLVNAQKGVHAMLPTERSKLIVALRLWPSFRW